MANVPFSWVPTDLNAQGHGPSQAARNDEIPGAILPGGQVGYGDWVQVLVNWRGGPRVVYAPGQFLIHVIYTPNSDDANPHEGQAVTYGGPLSGVAGLGANRRRNFHIDPGVAFQVPWDGTISVLAGGKSASTAVCDVLLVRGFAPKNVQEQARILNDATEMVYSAETVDDLLIPQQMMQAANRAPPLWAPPIVGVPQLLPCTYVDIKTTDTVAFPDGAVKMSTIFTVAAASSPVRVAATVLGNAINFQLNSGIPVDIGSIAVGGACTSGVGAEWTPNNDLELVTIWSSLGG